MSPMGERQKLIVGSLGIFLIAIFLFAYNIATGGASMPDVEMSLIYVTLAVMTPLLLASYFAYDRIARVLPWAFLLSTLALTFMANHMSHRGVRNPATMALVLLPYLAVALISTGKAYWLFVSVIPLLLAGHFYMEATGRVMYDYTDTQLVTFDILAPVVLVAITAVHAYTMQRQHESSLIAHEDRGRALTDVARMKSDFLALVSHDLRTPINAIAGTADYIYRHAGTPELRADVSGILASARDLLSMVNDILDVSRLQSGQFFVETRPVNLVLVLETLAASSQRQAAAKGLRFLLCVDGEYTVSAEPRRLRQVFQNLIDNAIRYTPAGSVKVFTTYDADAGEVRVSVCDTGPGLDIAIADLFTPFVRGRRPDGGVGLGLPLVKGLVEAFGGRLEVGSDGRGSVFTVALPTAAGETAEPESIFTLCIVDPHPPLISEHGWHICYVREGPCPPASLYAVNAMTDNRVADLQPNLIYLKDPDTQGCCPGAVSAVDRVADIAPLLGQAGYRYALAIGGGAFADRVRPFCQGMQVIASEPDVDHVAAVARHDDVVVILRSSDLGVRPSGSRTIVVLEAPEDWLRLREYLAAQPPNDYAAVVLDAVWEMAV